MAWIIGLYGLFCIAGGIIGFIRADSAASLLIGGIGGIVLLACAAGIAKGRKVAALIALIISLAFGLRFLFALTAQFKVMPHLLMVIFSAIAVAASIWALVAGKKPR